jgi:hypothetical protein
VSRKKRKKPKPDLSPTLYVADKKRAAIGQLESAILLWFNEADPISILVLAGHAHDCYHALGKKVGKPSWHQEFLDKRPPSFRERATYIQDFAKHGFMDLEESTPFDMTYAEGLMLVSIERHGQILGRITPLMSLYWVRAFAEHPSWMGEPEESLPQILIDLGTVEEVGRGTRKECLQRFQSASETLPLVGFG